MQKLEAIINSSKLLAVQAALDEIGISGMTVYEVRGAGRQPGHNEVYRGKDYWVSFQSKVKIDIVLDDADVDDAIRIISNVARTGNVGDGKIYLSPISRVVRIRTGEEGQDAL